MVGAPYEVNGTYADLKQPFGALYVFNGGPNGALPYPSQIIHGAQLQATGRMPAGGEMRGFGYSAKGGKDLDDNGYKDVVVGAYLSDHAVVIR